MEEFSKAYFDGLTESKNFAQENQTIITNNDLEMNSVSELLENVETTPVNTPETQEADVSNEPVEQITNKSETGFAPRNEETRKILSPAQLILLCILCAFVCGATIAVIILLVNRKK